MGTREPPSRAATKVSVIPVIPRILLWRKQTLKTPNRKEVTKTTCAAGVTPGPLWSFASTQTPDAPDPSVAPHTQPASWTQRLCEPIHPGSGWWAALHVRRSSPHDIWTISTNKFLAFCKPIQCRKYKKRYCSKNKGKAFTNACARVWIIKVSTFSELDERNSSHNLLKSSSNSWLSLLWRGVKRGSTIVLQQQQERSVNKIRESNWKVLQLQRLYFCFNWVSSSLWLSFINLITKNVAPQMLQ